MATRKPTENADAAEVQETAQDAPGSPGELQADESTQVLDGQEDAKEGVDAPGEVADAPAPAGSVTYKNKRSGTTTTYSAPHPGLEKSKGWERVRAGG